MNKKNVIYALLITIILFFIAILFLLKITFLNEKYIIKNLEKNNYYELVYNETKDTIISYIMSSGLPNNVVENIFTYNDVKDNINNYVYYIYGNKEFNNNKESVKEVLINNINNYLNRYSIDIDNKNELDDLINEIINIYDNETLFYKKINNYVDIFQKIKKIITVILIVLILILIMFILILKSTISNFLSSCFMSSGLILLFIKFVLYDKINYMSILIITEMFSNILNKCFEYFSNILTITGIIFIILSIIMMYIELKRSKKNGRN